MSLVINLPEWEDRLREEAAEAGKEPGEYVSELLKRQLVLHELEALKQRKPPQSLADLKPKRPAPPGQSWIAAIVGKWPGDESDEEVERILEEMS
ncbi:MAG: hypothetical protein ACK47B_20760 [Armatimonadota bacterium]